VRLNNGDTEQNLGSGEKTDFELLKGTIDSNETLQKWVNYYKSHDTNFSLDNFISAGEWTIDEIQGNVCGIFDECFERNLANLMVFSPDKKRYIDLDSYAISLDENNVAYLDADCEVNVVDIENRTVTRVAFYAIDIGGEIDDAFWENNSKVVLLETIYYDIPDKCSVSISIIDLSTKKAQGFDYKNTLNFKSDYYMQRLKKAGVTLIE
jgi:hypothetical protein